MSVQEKMRFEEWLKTLNGANREMALVLFQDGHPLEEIQYYVNFRRLLKTLTKKSSVSAQRSWNWWIPQITPSSFFALEQAWQTNPHGLMVSGKTVEKLTQLGKVTFMSKDGLAGALVTADGDIETVLKNPRSNAKDAGGSLLLNTVNNSGNKLDCYGEGLIVLYKKCSFEPVAKVAWDPAYTPDGWTYGPKNVYVMKLSGGLNADAVASRLGLFETESGFHIWSKVELDALPSMDYDQALGYRDELIRQVKFSSNAKGNEDIGQLLSHRLQLPKAVVDDTLVFNYSIPSLERNVNTQQIPSLETDMPDGTVADGMHFCLSMVVCLKALAK